MRWNPTDRWSFTLSSIGKPKSHRRPFAVSAELFPFTSRWLELDGLPIHYIDEGSGPILLLLHGNFMWCFSFRHLIQELKSDFRCIAIDLPGMGMSGKPHAESKKTSLYSLEAQSRSVEKVLDLLELKNMTLFANDHGGPIGLGIATRRPELFDKLFITNSWAWSNEQYPATRRWSQLAPIIPWLTHKLLFRKQQAWIFESPSELKIPGVWDACTAPYRTPTDLTPALVLAEQLTKAPEYFATLNTNLERLATKPVAIVWATRSGGLFPEFVEEQHFLQRWKDLFPSAKTTLMPTVGYYFLSRPPAILLERLRHFAA